MEELYLFIHNEWTDFCDINKSNLTIIRKGIKNECGTYKIINNEFIINWEKWEGNDIFINYNNCYYHKDFYTKNIKNKKLTYIKLFYDEIIKECVLNNDKIIFDQYNIINYGSYLFNNKYLVLKWENKKEEKFIEINNKYYEEQSLYTLLDRTNNLKKLENNYLNLYNDNIINNSKDLLESEKIKNIVVKKKKIEKFKKINSDFYLNPKINKEHTLFHNLFKHKIINFELNYNIINQKIGELNKNISLLKNKKYINLSNVNDYLINFNDGYIKEFYDSFFLNLKFQIPLKKGKRTLSLVEWGYPPFGGGENWILNFNKILFNNNYDNYLICFSDPFKNTYFTDINFINLEYVKIIQMPKDIFTIIKMIRVINPDLINHQGVYRDFYMKISNILEIPFLTGFCFWQNIIKLNADNLNVNMISNNNLEQTDEFHTILENSYTYASSNFVNDIVHKLYNINLDVIETISLKEDFYVYDDCKDTKDTKDAKDAKDTKDEKKYVTLINCHYNKGGYLLDYLFNNLDFNIPIMIVYTENDPIISLAVVEDLINKRNNKKNINILFKEKIDIKIIYKQTKIILTPSVCDETFCRVGYEAMLNKIPILSSKNGNLKYLLKDYAIFIDNFDMQKWNNTIEEVYYDENMINSFANKNIEHLNEQNIEKKIMNKLESITESKYKLGDNNIGLIIPWADQGLGIQGREYYITLKKLGFNPYVLSFRPYHATYDNIYLQSDKDEWDYENIIYSTNYRENLTYNEIIDFIYKYKIKKIIIIEATFTHIFKIAQFLKILNVKIYLVVNIECIRLVEVAFHDIFDMILTNNGDSNKIIKQIFNNKTSYLGFNLNHHYFKNIIKNNKKDLSLIKFCCSGGLNSISRKNIDLIIIAFYNIFNENKNLNWELNIYIQGVEIPEMLNKYKCNKIKYHLNNLSYKDIVQTYIDNDIFIHMGSHEGLGLGFYESLYCGTPILSMDWTPNNEIIDNYVNGWLVICTYGVIHDNDNSLINKGIIYEIDLKNKIIEILNNKNTLSIINNTINNRKHLYNENKKMFESNLLKLLSS